MPGRFIAMAGALIWRESDGRYLLLQRSAERDVGAGGWECVTGRLEQGEGFREALQREVFEETGLEVRIEFFLDTAHSYRGDAVPENEMVGVYYGCSTEDGAALRLSDEHSVYEWVTPDEAATLLPDHPRLLDLIMRADGLGNPAPRGDSSVADKADGYSTPGSRSRRSPVV